MNQCAWAQLLIDQLVQLGVTYFVLSPGSRSTPLAVAIAQHPHPDLTAHVHFDERGSAFHALGYAMGSGKPVAVVVTTGTAAGNLLPAIMEASKSFIPLIILTSDRPPELRDCGANQTIDQVKIFSSFVRWEVDLPCASSSLTPHYLRSTLAQAVFRATGSPQGPVHLNCMFREPLTGPHIPTPYIPICHYGHTETSASDKTLQEWGTLLNGSKKGILILGSLSPLNCKSPIYLLAEKLGWPIFADILSNARGDLHSHIVPFYDLILKGTPETEIDCVLHLGERIVSKTLQEWLKKFPSAHYLSVSDHPFRHDPSHQVTHRLSSSPITMCENLLPLIQETLCNEWLLQWQNASHLISKKLGSWKDQETSLTEPGVALSLADVPADFAIFISNSMPIRDADLFLFPQTQLAPIFANRGVSGIDGNIATAVGIAQGTKTPTVAVLGDLAALHDLNSLMQLKSAPYPVIFVIVNNGGGGIFSFLKGPSENPCFETFFAHAHTLSFKHAADLFELPYYHPATWDEYKMLLHSCSEKRKSCIIEISTKRSENLTLHETLYLCFHTQSQVLNSSPL